LNTAPASSPPDTLVAIDNGAYSALLMLLILCSFGVDRRSYRLAAQR
jgi:hypothetical protein